MQREGGLKIIIAYKLGKGGLWVALGLLGAVLTHLGLGDHLLGLADHLRHHSRAWSVWLARLLTSASTGHRLWAVVVALLADGALSLVEGWALLRGHWWGPWLVVAASGSLLPLELVELVRKPHLGRAILLLVNLVIVIYLVRKARSERRAVGAGEAGEHSSPRSAAGGYAPGMTDSRTALITGASSGIGAAIARNLAGRKYDCVLTARRTDRLQALASELEKAHGVRAHVIASDLGIPGGADRLAAAVAELGVAVDVLVNNAGFGVYGAFVDQPAERVSQMIELNLTSLTTLTRHYVKPMVERRRGRILQISSVGAYQPSPLYAVYSATKAYVLSFSEALDYELRGTGVTVTTVCPGLTATEFHEVADHVKPRWMNGLTMTADEVAALAVRATMNGRAVLTPGLPNKLTAFFVRLLPRSFVTAMAAMSMRSRA